MVIRMAEASLETPWIEAERDQHEHVQIDKQQGGIVFLDPEEAEQVAKFILATNPNREPGSCQICGQETRRVIGGEP